MAKDKSEKPKRNIKQEKTKPTMRELANNPTLEKNPSRVRRIGKKAVGPLSRVRSIGGREYHPLKLPDNRAGRILNKRVRLIPRFLREAWAEIRQVTWPGRRETVRLTFAVFVFSAVFAVIVSMLDLGLDKLFREFIIKV